MRKKILGIAVMAAVALTAGWNISQSENDVKLSDLALDNVEALASGEGSSTCYTNCIFDYNYECYVFGGYPSPTYCFYYRAR